MTASASATASRRTCRSGEAKPVSRLSVRSCARSRSVDDLDDDLAAGASARTVASVSRSASRRVDEGWLSAGRDDGDVERVHFVTSRVASRRRCGAGSRRRAGEAWVGASGTWAGLQRGELLAQHRHDLLAEDVELLEHGLQRQAGVVDEEQLALVVADVLAEAERPLDDLLRAADGQRGLLGELLQRRAVAVDRGVVEVGPELAHGVLAVLAHEHLAAEADDRLVGAAVAVVLEAAAVELRPSASVWLGRPEDVVVEEAVAVVGGLLGDLGAADRAVPDERRDAVERARASR